MALNITRQRVLTVYWNIRIYATMKIEIADMLAAADEASELLKALANRHRLIIVCQLIEQERSVGELAALSGNSGLDGLPASGVVAQGWAGDGTARRPDHLVFNRQPSGARTRTHPPSGLLRASCDLRLESETQAGANGPAPASCDKLMIAARSSDAGRNAMYG